MIQESARPWQKICIGHSDGELALVTMTGIIGVDRTIWWMSRYSDIDIADLRYQGLKVLKNSFGLGWMECGLFGDIGIFEGSDMMIYVPVSGVGTRSKH